MNGVFKLRDETHYHLRHTTLTTHTTYILTHTTVGPIYSVFINSESALYLSPKIWEQIPTEIKNKDSFVWFKKEIRKWKPFNCPCRTCKTFIANFDFI